MTFSISTKCKYWDDNQIAEDGEKGDFVTIHKFFEIPDEKISDEAFYNTINTMASDLFVGIPIDEREISWHIINMRDFDNRTLYW